MSTLSPERSKGIGGSEAAAVLGLSRFQTPYQVWCDKTGQTTGERESTAAMKWGLLLEPIVRQEYSNLTGRTVLLPPPPGHVVHPKHSWMMCSPDGVTEDGRLVEIKTAAWASEWGEEGTDEIPTPYLIQVQHNMAVMDLQVADVPVLIGGRDFRLYEIPADPELQAMLIEREREFWQMVESRTPPPPISYADAVARFPVSKAQTVEATPEIALAVHELASVTVKAKEAENYSETLKFRIVEALGEADTLVDSSGVPLVTWKQSRDSERFDAKAFAEAHPDLYKHFCVPTPGSRRFLLKVRGEKDGSAS